MRPGLRINPLEGFDIKTGDFDGNGQDDIVMNIPGQGIWTRLNNNAWSQLHIFNTSATTIGDIDGDAQHRKDIIATFPGYGVWAWTEQHHLDTALFGGDASVLATVDLEKNGKDDVIMSFPGIGTWLWKNNASWEQLYFLEVTSAVAGRFDIN